MLCFCRKYTSDEDLIVYFHDVSLSNKTHAQILYFPATEVETKFSIAVDFDELRMVIDSVIGIRLWDVNIALLSGKICCASSSSCPRSI